jgi:twinkle protein
MTNFIQGQYLDIPTRKINQETCKRFSYAIGEHNGKPCHIANYRNMEGATVAQKYRYADKTFRCEGTPLYFFGQNLFPNGGKRVVITEGEIDCLTVSQLFDNNWAVVSLPSGCQSAKSVVKKHFEWLCSWEEVVLMFDSDDQGQKAMVEVCNLLPAGKCKLAKLPLKDPNAMLLEGKGKDVVYAVYNSKTWRPDDIVDGVDIYELLKNPKENTSIPYPFSGLNTKTRGIRKGEIVTFCAGSGIGKSQVCRVVAHHILTQTDKGIGYIALEESLERTAQGILGIHMNKQMHLEPQKFDEETEKAFKETVGSGRFFMYDHWGSIGGENLLTRIRYMAKCLDVEYVVLDHLSIVVSGIGDGDERRMIDNTMTKLRSLVEETKIGMILVSHLKRPDGKGHEEGAVTSLAQLRGSASIAQLSDMVIGLERDQQDPENANQTVVRVLKNRFSGETGIATALHYDKENGSLREVSLDIENPF